MSGPSHPSPFDPRKTPSPSSKPLTWSTPPASAWRTDALCVVERMGGLMTWAAATVKLESHMLSSVSANAETTVSPTTRWPWRLARRQRGF